MKRVSNGFEMEACRKAGPESRLFRSADQKRLLSVLDGLFQVFVLIDLPDVVLAVAVEIHHGRRRRAESPLRSLDDLDAVVGMTALGDQRLLLEAQLLERGGILRVVMNIMMVSVTERTREIGTRKALGAPAAAIRMQFITESVILCLIGGIAGILLGLALGAGLSKAVGYAARPSLTAIVVAVGFSMAIGVFFGYYPANKAAKLDPIEALRYE